MLPESKNKYIIESRVTCKIKMYIMISRFIEINSLGTEKNICQNRKKVEKIVIVAFGMWINDLIERKEKKNDKIVIRRLRT